MEWRGDNGFPFQTVDPHPSGRNTSAFALHARADLLPRRLHLVEHFLGSNSISGST